MFHLESHVSICFSNPEFDKLSDHVF